MDKNHQLHWKRENWERFCKFITGDDLDFYEEWTIHLSDAEQEVFFRENPDFMSEYPISRDMIYLLKDPLYRRIMRAIKKYEKESKKTPQEDAHG